MGRLFSVDLLCCLQVITTMADVLTSVHDRRFFTFNFDWTIFSLDRLSALPAQTYKLMSQLWSALWRRRRRGAGQRGRGGKNSITQWWWGQMFSVKKDNGQCSGFMKACSVSVTIWFWASLSFFVLFATGVEREHQGSLQGATSSALRPRSVLHLWIRVGQHMITNSMKYCMTIEVNFSVLEKFKIIQFYDFLYQACVIRRSGLCNQWCEFPRLFEFHLFYCC